MQQSLSQMLFDISFGNEDAFRGLVRQFSDKTYQFACSIVKNAEDAEEIISDVFLNIWLHRENLPAGEQFIFYLYKAVKNTSLNYLKKKNRQKESAAEPGYFLETVGSHYLNPEEIVISRENVLRIEQVINALPGRCRQVFVLVKEDGLSYREVAELLDISPATVNVQMTIALKKIWQELVPDHHRFLS